MSRYSTRRSWWNATAATSALAAAVTFAAIRVVLGSGSPLELLSGLLVAAAVIFGPAVAVGGALGVVVGDLATGSLGAWTALDAIGVAAVPLGVCLLWGHAGLVPPGIVPRMTSARQVAEYLVVAAVSVVTALALNAWVAPALGLQPFYTEHVAFLANSALVTIVGALALLGLGRVEAVDAAAVRSPAPAGRLGSGRLLVAFVLAVGWYLVGTGVGALTHDVRLFGNEAAVRAYAAGFVGGPVGSAFGRVLVVLWSVGDLIVVALGVVAAAVVGYVLTPRSGRSRSSLRGD